MKSKALMVVIIFLLASLTCLGVVSCGSDSTPVPGGIETPDESTDVPQAPSEDANIYDMAIIAAELSARYYDLDQLLVKPEIEDDDWILNVTLELADIMTLCDQAWQIVSPDSMTDVEVIFLEAINHFDDAADLLVKGIDEKNIDLMNQASAEMWLATEILAQGAELPE